MPQYMSLNQSGWPTVCPSCGAELDWHHTESIIDEQRCKQTAFFVPVCVRRCTQDRMRLETKEYPALSVGWRPLEAGKLPNGVKLPDGNAAANDAD
jgi:hypothetical protein